MTLQSTFNRGLEIRIKADGYRAAGRFGPRCENGGDHGGENDGRREGRFSPSWLYRCIRSGPRWGPKHRSAGAALRGRRALKKCTPAPSGSHRIASMSAPFRHQTRRTPILSNSPRNWCRNRVCWSANQRPSTSLANHGAPVGYFAKRGPAGTTSANRNQRLLLFHHFADLHAVHACVAQLRIAGAHRPPPPPRSAILPPSADRTAASSRSSGTSSAYSTQPSANPRFAFSPPGTSPRRTHSSAPSSNGTFDANSRTLTPRSPRYLAHVPDQPEAGHAARSKVRFAFSPQGNVGPALLIYGYVFASQDRPDSQPQVSTRCATLEPSSCAHHDRGSPVQRLRRRPC